MKITEKQIRELVRESVKEKILEMQKNKLLESSDFTAKRQIMSAAGQTAMNFENEIIKLLGLTNPDNLEPHLQQKFLKVANEMKNKMISAVAEAVNVLSTFPRGNENQEVND